MKNKEILGEKKFSLKQKTKFILVISFTSFIAFMILTELGLMLFFPQPYEYPTISFSPKFRKIYYPNTTIVLTDPPEKRYFSTNEIGCRGKYFPVSNAYKKPSILLLGDSYTFGIGVNDGYEFGSVMAKKLKQEFDVINLGMGGWGLTQEIRIFYEFGQLYSPKYVILQFCHNDPNDNILDCVTKIEDDKFVFIDSDLKSTRALRRLSKMLSKSVIQKSNLYNLVRNALYIKYYKSATYKANEIPSTSIGVAENEKKYVELLTLFANDLQQKGFKLFMFSVNICKDGKIVSELHDFPFIENCVEDLDSLQWLDYIDINVWFTPKDMIPSPVGHYDTGWNHVLGENLANYIKNQENTVLH